MKAQRPAGSAGRLREREQHVARPDDDEREHAEAELLGAAAAADDAHVEGTGTSGVVVVVVVVVVLVAACGAVLDPPDERDRGALVVELLAVLDRDQRVLGEVVLGHLGVLDDRRVPDQQTAGPALVDRDLAGVVERDVVRAARVPGGDRDREAEDQDDRQEEAGEAADGLGRVALLAPLGTLATGQRLRGGGAVRAPGLRRRRRARRRARGRSERRARGRGVGSATAPGGASAAVPDRDGHRDRDLRPDRGRRGRERVGAVVLDVDDDRRDVVLAAGRVRRVDEEVGGAGRVALPAQQRADGPGPQHRGETVRAEQQPVAGEQRHRVHVDLDVVLDAERPGDDRALRVHRGLLLGEPALAHQLLDQAVVGGQLAELAVAQQVRRGSRRRGRRARRCRRARPR